MFSPQPRRVGRTARLWAARLLMTTLVLVGGVFGGEVICRALDGYRLDSIALRAARESRRRVKDDTPDLQYVAKIPRAPGVNVGWYVEEPKEIPRIPLTPELQQRAAAYPTEPWSAFFEWNLAYLREQACRPERDVVMGNLRDFYYFESVDGSRYPSYRHLPHVSPPNWFVTSTFGWRGPEVALNKPPDTIRIAFVGASTTVDAFGVPFSHPELVGYWLNRWAAAKGLPYRFDVINAGRSGIDSNSIAAVVTQELLPVEPDLVIYYEGANQLWPGQLVSVDDGRSHERPTTTFRKRTAAEDYSAMVRRVIALADRLQARGGYEPHKPSSRINWPADVDEADPALASPKLPMDLPNIVACLDIIRKALAGAQSELVLSSFVWIVHDGMRLNLDRDLTLYNYLNQTYWPFSYAQMRRIADFQNRVFEKYARAHQLPFIDMAREFPQDPALAGDAIHLRYRGLVLQAWIYLQHLIPIIEDRLADGRLPRTGAVTRSVHPAFTQPSPRLITLDQLRAGCR
ncbi:MAG: hypothetical protein ABJA98_29820 [Acidobacteriota bacterium]